MTSYAAPRVETPKPVRKYVVVRQRGAVQGGDEYVVVKCQNIIDDTHLKPGGVLSQLLINLLIENGVNVTIMEERDSEMEAILMLHRRLNGE